MMTDETLEWIASPSANKYQVIAKKHTPPGVTGVAWAEKPIEWRNYCEETGYPICCRKIVGPTTLLEFLREIAHFHLGHIGIVGESQTSPRGLKPWERMSGLSWHRAEYDATVLAMQWLDDDNVKLNMQTQVMLSVHIDITAERDLRHGCPSVDPDVAVFLRTG